MRGAPYHTHRVLDGQQLLSPGARRAPHCPVEGQVVGVQHGILHLCQEGLHEALPEGGPRPRRGGLSEGPKPPSPSRAPKGRASFPGRPVAVAPGLQLAVNASPAPAPRPLVVLQDEPETEARVLRSMEGQPRKASICFCLWTRTVGWQSRAWTETAGRADCQTSAPQRCSGVVTILSGGMALAVAELPALSPSPRPQKQGHGADAAKLHPLPKACWRSQGDVLPKKTGGALGPWRGHGLTPGCCALQARLPGLRGCLQGGSWLQTALAGQRM